jgi:hypothetical protein
MRHNVLPDECFAYALWLPERRPPRKTRQSDLPRAISTYERAAHKLARVWPGRGFDDRGART